jgi:hypothetical protein
MTGFAKAWSKYLPDNHRNALFSALSFLSDEFFDYDLEHQDHTFRWVLPRKYINFYTPTFLKKFYITLLTVGYKLDLSEKSDTLVFINLLFVVNKSARPVLVSKSIR